MAASAVVVPLALATLLSTLRWVEAPGFPGFFVMRNRCVPTVWRTSWTGAGAGVPFHARIVAVGETPVTSQAAFVDRTARPPGTTICYTIEKGGSTERRCVPTMGFGWGDWVLTVGLFLIDGLIVSAAAIMIALMQPTTAASHGFLAFGLSFGVMLLTGPTLYDPRWSWLTPLHLTAQATWPASFIHLGLVFPIVRPSVRRQPWRTAIPYAVSAALAVWGVWGFDLDPPRMAGVYLSLAYTAVGMVGFVILLVLAYVEAQTEMVRAQVRILVPSFVLSSALACFGYANIARAGGDFPMNYAMPMPMLFYLGIAYVIARYDLFAIDRFVKQAAVYGLVTAAITGTYAFGLAGLFAGSDPATESFQVRVFTLLFVVSVGVLAEPLRARAQRLVDRFFLREQVDFRDTVRNVSARLSALLEVEDVLTHVARVVQAGFSPEWLHVCLWTGGERRDWLLREGVLVPAAPTPLDAGSAIVRPWTASEPDAHPPLAEHIRETLPDLTVVAPLQSGDESLGAFLLGGKASGLPFTPEDVALLETLAQQTAIAIQKVQSYRALQRLNQELESKVESRTEELQRSNAELGEAYQQLQATQAQLLQNEKLAGLGQLVAGLAHEINTPVTAIIGNLEPLVRRLDQLRNTPAVAADPELAKLGRRIEEIVGVMGRGAERTAGIVRDLRLFSRVDEPDPLPTDLNEGIEMSIRLLRPRWAERIKVHTDFQPLPLVEGHAGQLNQVFMNLLANAFDAIADRGNVWVETRADGDEVVVSVRDDGCGIPADRLRRVFDPFYTTKPTGQGTGLGLAISANIVRAHGGRISMTSTPGAGSTCTVVLPLRRGSR